MGFRVLFGNLRDHLSCTHELVVVMLHSNCIHSSFVPAQAWTAEGSPFLFPPFPAQITTPVMPGWRKGSCSPLPQWPTVRKHCIISSPSQKEDLVSLQYPCSFHSLSLTLSFWKRTILPFAYCSIFATRKQLNIPLEQVMCLGNLGIWTQDTPALSLSCNIFWR